MIWKSLRLFVKTVSAVDKCSLPNTDNLMQPIHMQLSQKLKTFSGFFNVFSKSRLSFEYFQNKDDAHSLFICVATACKKRGYIYFCPFTCNYLKNEKHFSQFFPAFSKSRLIFEHFQKKDDAHSLFIS